MCSKLLAGVMVLGSTDVTLVCSKGCELCSEFNGCVKCSPKFFILLERSDIRQIGVCVLSCPAGHFDVRNREINKCMKCKINNCESCFSRHFCTKCNEGFYLHKGSCYSKCPEGFTATNGTMECSSAQCEMSEWGAWSPCSRTKTQCGKKKGKEERSRKILQAPFGGISLCQPTTERRKCTMPKIPCPKGEKGRKNNKKDEQGKKENNKNRNKNAEDAGNKKRKGQQRVTSMPITLSIPAQ